MVFGFIIGLVVAHILTFIHVDQDIISGIRDIIKVDIGHSGYYLMMGVLGGISRVMIGGFISGIVVAYLFTFVKFDHIIIEGIKEWFKYDMGMGAYYLLFAVIGAGVSFLEVVRMFLRPLFFMTKRRTYK